MICEVCNQRNAEIVFKTVTGNQVATKAMCMGCAHSMQQDMIKMFLALGFRQDQIDHQTQEEAPEQLMPRYICAHCGRPYDRLDEQTMAGCAQCYEAIKNDLLKQEPMEAPGTDANEELADSGKGLEDLRYRLLEAVVNEQFEEAAQLRDQIKQLNSAGGQA